MSTWTITLHAEGSPLADERVQGSIVAAAHALAERFGIEVVSLATTTDSIEVTLGADEVTAVGFAAELRRSTNAWYLPRHGGQSLWISPREG
jgi:hypothetical protein